MRFLLNAAAALIVAALWTGTGPFAAFTHARWQAVAAELAESRPQERLVLQAKTMFRSGTPRPDGR